MVRIVEYIKSKLGVTEPGNFSRFFRHADSKEKKKVIREVIRKSTEDQLATIAEYDRAYYSKPE
jgi:hypothetical protein